MWLLNPAWVLQCESIFYTQENQTRQSWQHPQSLQTRLQGSHCPWSKWKNHLLKKKIVPDQVDIPLSLVCWGPPGKIWDFVRMVLVGLLGGSHLDLCIILPLVYWSILPIAKLCVEPLCLLVCLSVSPKLTEMIEFSDGESSNSAEGGRSLFHPLTSHTNKDSYSSSPCGRREMPIVNPMIRWV